MLSALMVVESGGEGTGLSLLGFWQSSLVLVHQWLGYVRYVGTRLRVPSLAGQEGFHGPRGASAGAGHGRVGPQQGVRPQDWRGTGHHRLWPCHVPWVLLRVDFIPGAQSRGSLMAVPGVHSEKLDLSCRADQLTMGRRQWIDQQPGCLGLTWGDRLGCP